MAGTQVQLRRGTTAEHATFTGAEGEVTVDITKDTLVAHDGTTAGGIPIAREDLTNVATIPATKGGTGLTSPGTSGNVLTSNGTTWESSALNKLTSDTAQASTSGTSIDFTGIPSWVKRITVMFSGVSTNGSSDHLFQVGTSGGVVTSGYLAAASRVISATAASANYTAGFGLNLGGAVGATVLHGQLVISRVGSNTWVASGLFGASNTNSTTYLAGSIALGGTLDRIRITTVNGTDTFDAGSINILYE